jgi:D-3-phosphoglycerate dehydrogenase
MSKYRVLVADKISQIGIDYLKAQPGIEVDVSIGLSPEALLEKAKHVHAIAVRSESKITREVIAAAPNLRVVGRAGVGVDNIDVPAASERGIIVMNTPGGNTVATAELTFTHLLCGTRPVSKADASMREGRWDRKLFSGKELFRKTLGVIGVGRIGAEVAKRARAFGMRVVAFDPYLTPQRAQALQVESMELDALLPEVDYITVHMPLTEGTKYMLNREAFARMKDGVRVFNCARGGIIEEAALLEALNSGKVAWAGLDVFEEEPLAKDHPLRSHPNVLLTPHLGASTEEAQESVGLEVAEAIAMALTKGVVVNAVNMPSVDAETMEQLRPYLTLGERLATLVQQLSPVRTNHLQITYQGKLVDMDLNPLTRNILRGYLLRISGDNVNSVNAPIMLERLGIRCEVTKTNEEGDYTELVRIEARNEQGETASASGTLLGLHGRPRIVSLNDRDIEAETEGVLLVFRNKDMPGIVGYIGTILATEEVNIASMSLSRNYVGGLALSIIQLDSAPSETLLKKIESHDSIQDVRVVKFT